MTAITAQNLNWDYCLPIFGSESGWAFWERLPMKPRFHTAVVPRQIDIRVLLRPKVVRRS